MAEPKQGSKANVAVARKNGRRKKTEDAIADTAEIDACKTSDSESNNKPEADAGPKKRMRGNGAELMKKLADKLLVENCAELAGLVLKNAKEGRTASTKLLVSLSEGNVPNGIPVKKRRRRGLTPAERLTLEPEWEGPSDSEVDTGFGGREPEA